MKTHNLPDEFFKTIQQYLSLEHGEKIMTLAEQFRAEGWKKGVAVGWRRGRMEGIVKGEEKAMTHIAKKLLSQKTDIEFIERLTGLSKELLLKVIHDVRALQ